MKDQVTERLEALRAEFAAGQNMAAELAARQAELQQTLLRISGAIQVLEELLAPVAGGDPVNGAAPVMAG